MESKIPTKQEKIGYKNPPKNRQFGQPEGNRRNNGAWKKEDTPRFKLEKMMALGEEELFEIASDRSRAFFERQLAKIIHEGDWKTFESMINQVYGTPKATNETTVTGEVSASLNRPYIGLTTEEIKKALGEE